MKIFVVYLIVGEGVSLVCRAFDWQSENPDYESLQ